MTTTEKHQNPQEENKPKPEIFNISKEKGRFKLSRRNFMKTATVTVGAATLMSCKFSDGATRLVRSVLTNPTSTPTITPTSTSTPTPTSTPTITPSPTPEAVLGEIAYDDIPLLSGPGSDYLFIGYLYPGMQVKLVGCEDSGGWFKIIVPLEYLPGLEGSAITQNGTATEVTGWVETYSITITQGNTDSLPCEVPPPAPTPLPNENPTGDDGVSYEYTDQYGQIYNYSLPCGSQIPEGAVCTCNCVSLCSCDNYVAPCSCDSYTSEGSICTCNSVSYWYPN